jgi:hypothetical protein
MKIAQCDALGPSFATLARHREHIDPPPSVNQDGI